MICWSVFVDVIFYFVIVFVVWWIDMKWGRVVTVRWHAQNNYPAKCFLPKQPCVICLYQEQCYRIIWILFKHNCHICTWGCSVWLVPYTVNDVNFSFQARKKTAKTIIVCYLWPLALNSLVFASLKKREEMYKGFWLKIGTNADII